MRLGASGFRLDVADELSDGFISGIRSAVKEENPDGLILGEDVYKRQILFTWSFSYP